MDSGFALIWELRVEEEMPSQLAQFKPYFFLLHHLMGFINFGEEPSRNLKRGWFLKPEALRAARSHLAKDALMGR